MLAHLMAAPVFRTELGDGWRRLAVKVAVLVGDLVAELRHAEQASKTGGPTRVVLARGADGTWKESEDAAASEEEHHEVQVDEEEEEEEDPAHPVPPPEVNPPPRKRQGRSKAQGAGSSGQHPLLRQLSTRGVCQGVASAIVEHAKSNSEQTKVTTHASTTH